MLVIKRTHDLSKMKLYNLFLFVFIAFVYSKSVKKDDDKYQLFEGDMLLEKDEIDAAIHGKDVDAVHRPQSFGYGMRRSYYRKWRNGIVPYDLSAIENSFTKFFGAAGPTEAAILNAMKEIEKKTCIRFKKRTTERNYIKVIDGGYGQCYSSVGMVGGAQKLSIGFECFYQGIAIHELLHALGMYHEQSRPDRDQYVEIVYENIQSDMKSNFRKYTHSSIDSLGSPYDYASIMHYPWNAFATWPWLTTIRSKTPGASFGQKSHMSDQDILQINRAYYCRNKI